MTEKEKMLAGQLYDPSDAELTALLIKARKLARRYNQTDEDDPEQRSAILRELLPNSPNVPSLQAPIYFDYGCNTTFGKSSSCRNANNALSTKRPSGGRASKAYLIQYTLRGGRIQPKKAHP